MYTVIQWMVDMLALVTAVGILVFPIVGILALIWAMVLDRRDHKND